MRDDGTGHGAEHHARDPTQATGAHDHHGRFLGHLQQHVNRGTLRHRVADVQVRRNLERNLTCAVHGLQGLALQLVKDLLRRHHALRVEELRHGVRRREAQRDVALHRRVRSPADCIVGGRAAVYGNNNDIFLGHVQTFPRIGWL